MVGAEIGERREGDNETFARWAGFQQSIFPSQSSTPFRPITETLIHYRALQFYTEYLAANVIPAAVAQAQIRRFRQILLFERSIFAPTDTAS